MKGSIPSGVFTAARRHRTLDDVVAQVRDAIFAGSLSKGDRLPAERELSAVFGVSRSTLREALRVLEALGAVEIRTGAAGGIFVAEPSEEQLAASFEALLRFRGATDPEIFEYGIALLSETAYWAAVRASDDELGAIAEAVDAAVDAARDDTAPARFLLAYSAFLRALAAATNNQVRLALVLGIHRSLLRGRAAELRAAAQDLRLIAEAVRERNARVARVRMRRHLLRLGAGRETIA